MCYCSPLYFNKKWVEKYKALLTSGQIFEQNLSPFMPNVEMGMAPLQSVVVLLASKNVACLGQLSSKNACTNVKLPETHKKTNRKTFFRFMLFHFLLFMLETIPSEFQPFRLQTWCELKNSLRKNSTKHGSVAQIQGEIPIPPF